MPMTVGTQLIDKKSRPFELPDDAVTQTFAILGKRGSGKSSAAKKIAEQMHEAGHQFVALDPKGDWHGLRSSADGNRPGLPIPIFGGLHGDLPLAPTGGAVMAQLIVDQGLSCVLDVSDFDTKADQVRFLTDFGTALYKAARRAPAPLHLFLEEADEVLPQQVPGEMARCVGAWTKIVKLGRSFGLGATIITQRSASVNKNALSQIDTLVAMRTLSPTDRKVVKDWVNDAADGGDMVDRLSSLHPGEAVVWSPYWLGISSGVVFDRPDTFDSGATPTGGRRRPVPVLADIDLGAIEGLLQATTDEQKANDPKELKARVRALERELADRPVPDPPPPVEVRVPFVPHELVAEVDGLLARVTALAAFVHSVTGPGIHFEVETADLTPEAEAILTGQAVPPPAPRPAPKAPPKRPAPGTAAAWPDGVGKAERAILTVLHLHGPVTRLRLAMQTGYSSKGGGFGNSLGSLRTRGWINTGDPIALTDDGAAIIPSTVEPLPEGQALIDQWRGKLGRAERLILETLVDVWPTELDRDEIAEATGYEAKGGGFGNALGRLRTLELIIGSHGQPMRASDDLMAGAGR